MVVGPTTVVVNAGGSFGLPEASRQLAERGWTGMARVSRLVTGAGVLVATAVGIVVLVAAPTLIRLLYGPKFVVYAPSARVFAVSIVILAFGVGPILNMTATRRVRPLFMVQLGTLALSVAAVCVLATLFGVTGAAMANLLTCAITVAAIYVLQSSIRRSVEETSRRSPGHLLDAVRQRIMRNIRFVLVLSPADSSAGRPPSESHEPYL